MIAAVTRVSILTTIRRRRVLHVIGRVLVRRGQKVAATVGLARRVVRAPLSGEVTLVKDEKLLLKVESPAFELQAGLPGTVVSIIAERGAIIETIGGLVQGVWGNGRIDSGMLARLANRPEEVFTTDQLDVSLRGSILL